jgi:hypothetical protein
VGAGPITFDYDAWVTLIPGMTGVNSTDAAGYFSLATMYIKNDGTGPVCDPAMLTNLLYLATAHVAFLLSPRTNGVPTSGGVEQAPPQIVGRVSNATEGSVSVQTDMPVQPQGAAWWQQTSYGAMVWQLLRQYMTMRYVARPRRMYNPPVRYFGGPGLS